MSKELTPLEALKTIRTICYQDEYERMMSNWGDIDKYFKIVKKALKRLKKIDNILAKYNVLNEYHLEEKLEWVKRLNDDKTIEIVNKERFDRTLKALEIIKENLVISCDENKNDKPCLTIGIKVNKDKLVVIYQTFDKDKIDLLKEVLL